MKARPVTPHLIIEESDPLLGDAACIGLTIWDVMSLGFSPMAFWCNEATKPILGVMCEKAGYCWEWVPDPNQPDPKDVPEYMSRGGKVVMTKVGK